MKQTLSLICEAKVSLKKEADQKNSPSGKISAKVTTWGPRDGEDGRKFNYQPEGFMDWANEFAKSGKPLPMFLNHNDMGMPVGQWDSFQFDDDGMCAEGKLYLSTVGGSDLYNVLKESPNMFGGVSVGAYADEAQMVDAETKLMVIGMKIRDFNIFSRVGPTWFPSVAKRTPSETVTAGTTAIQRKLLMRMLMNSADPKSST